MTALNRQDRDHWDEVVTELLGPEAVEPRPAAAEPAAVDLAQPQEPSNWTEPELGVTAPDRAVRAPAESGLPMAAEEPAPSEPVYGASDQPEAEPAHPGAEEPRGRADRGGHRRGGRGDREHNRRRRAEEDVAAELPPELPEEAEERSEEPPAGFADDDFAPPADLDDEAETNDLEPEEDLEDVPPWGDVIAALKDPSAGARPPERELDEDRRERGGRGAGGGRRTRGRRRGRGDRDRGPSEPRTEPPAWASHPPEPAQASPPPRSGRAAELPAAPDRSQPGERAARPAPPSGAAGVPVLTGADLAQALQPWRQLFDEATQDAIDHARSLSEALPHLVYGLGQVCRKISPRRPAAEIARQLADLADLLDRASHLYTAQDLGERITAQMSGSLRPPGRESARPPRRGEVDEGSAPWGEPEY